MPVSDIRTWHRPMQRNTAKKFRGLFFNACACLNFFSPRCERVNDAFYSRRLFPNDLIPDERARATNPGAGVPRRDISVHVAESRQRVAIVTEEHPKDAGGRRTKAMRKRRIAISIGCRFHARRRVFSNCATLFSRYVTLRVDRRAPNTKIRNSPEGLQLHLSRGALPLLSLRPRFRFATDRLRGLQRRGRLIIGFFFFPDTPAWQSHLTFHPVSPVCRRTYCYTMGYRDRAIMTTLGVIGCPSSAVTI